MSKRRKFSPEFKQGAVEQASQPGVSCAQIARELGIVANLFTPPAGSVKRGPKAPGVPRDDELARLKRELARVKKERDFYAKRQRSLPRSRPEVSGDPALSRRVPYPADVSVPEGLDQWLLHLAPRR